jgi:hypothetical protein
MAMKRGKSVDFTGYWQRHIHTYMRHTPADTHPNASARVLYYL